MATEKRLIYAEDLEQAIRDDLEIWGMQYALAFKHIREAKTVDAVEVVRCKDCKRRDCREINGRKIYGGCLYWGVTTRNEDFCFYGERRSDA